MQNNADLLLKEVTSDAVFHDFIRTPQRINKGDRNYVTPLEMTVRDVFSKKNPFWRFAEYKSWVAYRGKEPVGRITAILNRRYNGENQAREAHFGFIEAADDEQVFKTLLSQAESWAREQGAEALVGPLNPGLNYELGTLVEGFDRPPYIMLTYNQPWYDRRIRENGFEPDEDFFAYKLDCEDFALSEKMDRVAGRLRARIGDMRFRSIDLKNIRREADLIRDLYNDAFRGHYGYTSFEEAEFQYMAKDMAQIIDPDLLFVLEIGDETAGFILALPDLNEVLRKIPSGRLLPFGWWHLLWGRKKIRRVRVINIAVRQKFVRLGLGPLFYAEMVRRLRQNGYTGGELSWVSASNTAMNKAAQDLGGQVEKTYRVYRKKF